jgi:hypothetical protein
MSQKEMQRMVAEVMEGVEQMGRRMAADRSRVNLLHANTDLQLATLVPGSDEECDKGAVGRSGAGDGAVAAAAGLPARSA